MDAIYNTKLLTNIANQTFTVIAVTERIIVLRKSLTFCMADREDFLLRVLVLPAQNAAVYLPER